MRAIFYSFFPPSSMCPCCVASFILVPVSGHNDYVRTGGESSPNAACRLGHALLKKGSAWLLSPRGYCSGISAGSLPIYEACVGIVFSLISPLPLLCMGSFLAYGICNVWHNGCDGFCLRPLAWRLSTDTCRHLMLNEWNEGEGRVGISDAHSCFRRCKLLAVHCSC